MLIERRYDRFEHAVDISHHIIVPEAEDEITVRLQNPCALQIFARSLRVLAAVDLYDETRVRAQKIDNEAINRRLPSEFPPG